MNSAINVLWVVISVAAAAMVVIGFFAGRQRDREDERKMEFLEVKKKYKMELLEVKKKQLEQLEQLRREWNKLCIGPVLVSLENPKPIIKFDQNNALGFEDVALYWRVMDMQN